MATTDPRRPEISRPVGATPREPERDDAWMEWATVWPVIAFGGGFALNWFKESVVDSKAARRLKHEQFDLLQRETHLELQDAIPGLWLASMNAVAADRGTAHLDGPRTLEQDERVSIRIDEFRSRFQRAKALCSRLTDESVRSAAGEAVRACHDYQDSYFDPTVPDPHGEDWTRTSRAVDEAIEQLGDLLRVPPP